LLDGLFLEHYTLDGVTDLLELDRWGTTALQLVGIGGVAGTPGRRAVEVVVFGLEIIVIEIVRLGTPSAGSGSTATRLNFESVFVEIIDSRTWPTGGRGGSGGTTDRTPRESRH
jgi:hypothetical protein